MIYLNLIHLNSLIFRSEIRDDSSFELKQMKFHNHCVHMLNQTFQIDLIFQ